MSNARRVFARLATALAASAALAACAPLPMLMDEYGRSRGPGHEALMAMAGNPAASPRDTAIVVFVRPGWFGPGAVFRIIDDNGNFLGDLAARSYFATAVPPGHRVFIAGGVGDAVVSADLLPGRTYFVKVDATFEGLAVGVHLRPVVPGTPDAAALHDWLWRSRPLVPDVAAGQASMFLIDAQVRQAIRDGLRALARFTPAELTQHELKPDDGVAAYDRVPVDGPEHTPWGVVPAVTAR